MYRVGDRNVDSLIAVAAMLVPAPWKVAAGPPVDATFSVNFALCDVVPSLAITSMAYLPSATLLWTLISATAVPPPGAAISLGVRITKRPAGTLDVVKCSA